MKIDGDKIIIGEKNYKINKEFNNYLKGYAEYERKYFIELDKFDDIKFYRGLSRQLFIFIGFVFDRQIKLQDLENKFIIEELNILSTILDSIVLLSRGIGNLIYEGNILSALILLRSLLENILNFLIIFENNDIYEIKRRLNLYKQFSDIIAYEKADNLGVLEEKNKLEKELGKEKIKKIIDLFRSGKQYRFEKGIYGKKIGIGKLLKKFKLGIDEGFYQTMSLSTHGVYHNKNLLGNTTFAPNLNNVLYKGILYFHILLIKQVIFILVNYFYESKMDLAEFLDTILINLGKYNVKKQKEEMY